MSNQFQSVILTINKVVTVGKATMDDVRAVEEQGIPMKALLDEHLGGEYSRTVISAGGISASTFVAIIAKYVGSIETPAVVSKDEDGLKLRVERVRKAMLDEGAHPPYHRKQVERLRKDWPTLYHAVQGLVKS